MKYVIFLLLLLFLVTSVSAVDVHSEHSITLLAVSELQNGSLQGGTASMTLQVKPGRGAIFIESYPLAKIDTQVATRLANEVACSFTEEKCYNYDFFYTINADSPIIGGPSAGAATALLTYAVLEDLELRDDFAMTGAIGSGGVITPVAGIKEKTQAAAEKQKSFVILPILSFTPYVEEFAKDNLTFNLSQNESITTHSLKLEDLSNYSIDVIPVLTLQDAIRAASVQIQKQSPVPTLQPPEYYLEQMEETANTLCTRTETLFGQAGLQENNTVYNQAETFYNKSNQIDSRLDAYSRASFCYSANIQLRIVLLDELSQTTLEENYDNVLIAQNDLDKKLSTKEFKTFSDVETFVIVKERLLESRTYSDQINITNISTTLLATSIERYYSAVVWSAFFDLPGEEVLVDENALRFACFEQVHYVESRVNYLKTILPEIFLTSIDTELQQSYTYMSNHDYALCLFKSTKARANADLFLSTIGGATNESVRLITGAKLNRSIQLIQREQDNGRFPLLGYSYLGYSQQMIEQEPYTGLLFAEYAIGFSDLSAYFPTVQQSARLTKITWQTLLAVFFIGLFVGALSMLFIVRKSQSLKKKPVRKTRKIRKK